MKRLLLVLVLAGLASPAVAEVPFQFAAPGVRTPDDPDVNGTRLTVLYGKNRRVRGLDLGFLGVAETDSLDGFQWIFGMGRVHGDASGFSGSLINLHSGNVTGVNAAFLNQVDRVRGGANIGFVNVTNTYSMLDIGGLNVSERSSAQVGFLNVSKHIEGVQIGFINVAENGFLPVFPFFNFPAR